MVRGTTCAIWIHPMPLPDRAAYLGHGWTAYAALTRGLPVHPGDAVFVSSGGELPRNFVDGPIIWKGIYVIMKLKSNTIKLVLREKGASLFWITSERRGLAKTFRLLWL